MKVLGIDTATSTASAALVEDGKLILDATWAHSEQAERGKERANHAEILLPLIGELLNRAALSVAEISAMAVSLGPGSFTGLRIGLSTVKGLAYGWNIPVVGVPTLPAMAARVTGWNGFVCPLLDARKKEVYAALFHRRDRVLERVTEDVVSSPEKIIEVIQSHSKGEPCLLIGDGIQAYGALLRSRLGDSALFPPEEEYPSVASAVALLGEERIQAQEFDPPSGLVPVYLRLAEAELKQQDVRRVS